MDVIDQAITEVLAREGGKVNNPADPGGATNRGITLRTFRRYLGRDDAPVEELWALSEADTRKVYRWYIRQSKLDWIPYPDVLLLAIDLAVLHGSGNALRMLQRAVGVTDDGVVGPKTVAAVNRQDPQVLFLNLLAERAEFFGRLISGDLTDRDKDGIPDNTEFAAGWMKRGLADFLRRVA